MAMENKDSNLTPEQKEQKEIELENKILSILLPSVGLVAFIIGFVGFILTVSAPNAIGTAIFLLLLALLGAGGIAYGILAFLKYRRNKYRKKESVPSETPNA